MRSKFREMHDHMQNQMNQTNQNKNNYTDPSESANRTQPPQGDYIEFEEIKEWRHKISFQTRDAP